MIDANFRDRALYLPGPEVLLCADLHLGRDATSAIQASLGERADLTDRIDGLCRRFSPSEVVFAGDVLHSFSHTPADAAESFDGIVRTIEAHGARLAITPGNHDAMLAGVWQGETVREYRIDSGLTSPQSGRESNERIENDGTTDRRDGDGDGIVVCHGHEAPTGSAGTYVIGHDHPAIDIEGRRRPCYLYGKGVYDGADVVVLPAFTELAAGVLVNRRGTREFGSALVGDLGEFRPIVRDEAGDETLRFPPLREFRSML